MIDDDSSCVTESIMYTGYDSIVDLCVQSVMASARNMTTDQLKALLEDDAQMEAMIDGLSQIRNVPQDKKTELAQNKSLAEWNLAQEPRINQLKAQVKVTHANAQQLKQEVEGLKSQLDKTSTDRSLETTSALLQVEVQKADEEAEELARQFEDGALSADVFIKGFLEKKKLAHTRKIKSEKLANLLQDQLFNTPMGGRSTSMVQPPYPTAYPDIPQPNVNRHSLW
ncbi:unnamed protein product, partial [Mesorhabditis belari]|uniref:VPS37 C-terminal domain-containing protein n=1 Tax=Mesorhabditis belari TaxID=2138241 RepID=A0AAF3EIV0_9BILA